MSETKTVKGYLRSTKPERIHGYILDASKEKKAQHLKALGYNNFTFFEDGTLSDVEDAVYFEEEWYVITEKQELETGNFVTITEAEDIELFFVAQWHDGGGSLEEMIEDGLQSYAYDGWKIINNNNRQLRIRHEDGSEATGRAAKEILDELGVDY